MANLRDYVAAGYFLSRYTGRRDCTCVELRRVTLAHDHSQRSFFPESWTLSWCGVSRDERIERAAAFGIAASEVDRVIAWADQSFGSVFGAWDVFFTLDYARAAARSFLQNASDVELWGVGLHASLVSDYRRASAPPPPARNRAPAGPSGIHVAVCVRPATLAEGGAALGHEILVPEVGCGFNSPESRHVDERAALRAAGVAPNPDGLVDSFEDAIACCRLLDAHRADPERGIAGWLPWLVVRYTL